MSFTLGFRSRACTRFSALGVVRAVGCAIGCACTRSARVTRFARLTRSATRSTRTTTRSTTRSTRTTTHNRHGRLLIECLIAMLLLDASALVVVSLARGASASTQTANATTAALSLAIRGVETSIPTTCPSGTTSGQDALPTASVAWTERSHGRWREREVAASFTSSALSGSRTTTLGWRAARFCP